LPAGDRTGFVLAAQSNTKGLGSDPRAFFASALFSGAPFGLSEVEGHESHPA